MSSCERGAALERRILDHVRQASSSVVTSDLVGAITDEAGVPFAARAIRAALGRLVERGEVFAAGARRSKRYGATAEKAAESPFGPLGS